MRLVHYAPRHLAEVRDAQQEGGRARRGDKPNGLWVSVGADWSRWCRAERFGLEQLTHRTEIILARGANMLHLKTADDLDAFTREHGCEPEWSKGMPSRYDRRGYAIDWPTIARNHDGIIIAPYCWERRLHESTHWYYGWDCASGVIWNARAVGELRPLKVLPKIASKEAA